MMVMQLSQAIEEDDLWEIFEDCGAARLRSSSLALGLRGAPSFGLEMESSNARFWRSEQASGMQRFQLLSVIEAVWNVFLAGA